MVKKELLFIDNLYVQNNKDNFNCHFNQNGGRCYESKLAAENNGLILSVPTDICLVMENYVIGESRDVEASSPFPDLESNVVWMRVNAGSRIRNIMGYAIKKMKEPEVKQITWNGSGHAINKTVSCAEIMKRKIKGLHQVTKIQSRRIEEYWEPKMEGLERLKVNRDIPAISILLSKDELDSSQPGYQAPSCSDPAWLDRPNEKRSSSAGKQISKTSGSSQQKRKRKHKKDKSDSVKNRENTNT